jgi:hypothetical protein
LNLKTVVPSTTHAQNPYLHISFFYQIFQYHLVHQLRTRSCIPDRTIQAPNNKILYLYSLLLQATYLCEQWVYKSSILLKWTTGEKLPIHNKRIILHFVFNNFITEQRWEGEEVTNLFGWNTVTWAVNHLEKLIITQTTWSYEAIYFLLNIFS